MDYYKLLQLSKEPFSNSPDPDYFFKSQQHLACLQKLELALRLKRGLNVVIGDVGTGKTTLCRELIRRFAHEPDIETHLMLDPSFSSSQDFLHTLGRMLTGIDPVDCPSEIDVKEKIKQHLYSKGVEKNRTVLLIIDEGQKISPANVEILRELLNYETNEYKLLQMIVFAQKEFSSILQNHANFTDRINMLHHLEPMNFRDTRLMIEHRLKMAGAASRPLRLFTRPAMWAIYRNSRGYPRKIINLCHQSVLAMIIQNRSKAGWRLIRSCCRRMRPVSGRGRPLVVAGAAVLVAAVILVTLKPFDFWGRHIEPEIRIFKVPEPVRKQTESPSIRIDQVRSAPDHLRQPVLPETTTPSIPEPVEHVIEQAAVLPGSVLPEQKPPANSNASALALDHVEQAADPLPNSVPDDPNTLGNPESQDSPRMLGHLTVEPGDTILGMVRTIYGSNLNRHLRSVIEANPQIKNPNTIEIGDTVFFPPIRFNLRDNTQGYWWIILSECTNLPEAHHKRKHLKERFGIEARLIASWSAPAGLRFELTVPGYFVSELMAENYLKDHLHAELADDARIVNGWPEEYQIYSNPYADGVCP